MRAAKQNILFKTPTNLEYALEQIPGLTALWPLDDPSGNPFVRVINPAVPLGRNLVLTGDFASDTNWTKGTGWTISSGTAVATGVLANAVLSPTTAILQIGRAYQIVYDVVVTVGSVRVEAGTGALGTTRSGSGTYTENLICTTTTALRFNPVSTFTGTIDNVTVKELNIPASPGVEAPNLLIDGNMEASGVGAWTADSGATLSKQTTNPHSGTQVLRVAGTADTFVDAFQDNILTIGNIYRISGYCRGTGGAYSPTIRTSAGTTVFAGTNSVNWQSFDFLIVADSVGIKLVGTGASATDYVEFDDVKITNDSGIRLNENILQDGDMESSGVGVWPAGNSAIISKQTGTPHGGSQVLRIARNGVNQPYTEQIPFLIGKVYRIQGWVRSDGSFVALIAPGGVAIFTSTTSTSWQFFDLTYRATVQSLRLYCNATSGTNYCEFDDIIITELPPLIGLPVNGVIQGVPESNALQVSASFDGVNDLINLYSTQLNSVFSADEGTIVIASRVSSASVWTDGTFREHIRFLSDGNNFVFIDRDTVNNNLRFDRAGGGTANLVNPTVPSYISWIITVITWSKAADQVKAYINGIQVGSTLTGLGVWSGNLSSSGCVIGCSTTGAGSPWSGNLAKGCLFSRPLTAAEIYAIAQVAGVA